MSDIAIRVEGLSKQYRIGKRERYKTLRDTLTDTVMAPARRLRSALRGAHSEQQENPSDLIWALKDVSFEVPHGAVVGVIGPNGAGKSTLLKILSRITEPTEGYAEVRGRVGSLLDVGTGFHPELTGRENIYLNGAILGMKKAEIERKFDEIVAFAEVEKFIDTPVKHYSSGMYTRLAFAVAAHLEPEILIVDEVLAVGDAQFQKKCLGKMGEVAKQGRTIIFVSHQMNQIRRLCGSCVWLDRGLAREFGTVGRVLGSYEASFAVGGRTAERGLRHNSATFLSWGLLDDTPQERNVLTTMGHFSVKFILRVNRPIRRGVHGIALLKDGHQNMWGTAAYDLEFASGTYELVHSFPSLLLQPGVYNWQVSISDGDGMIDLWDCLPDLVIATEPVTHRVDAYAGVLNLPTEFSFSRSVANIDSNEANMETEAYGV